MIFLAAGELPLMPPPDLIYDQASALRGGEELLKFLRDFALALVFENHIGQPLQRVLAHFDRGIVAGFAQIDFRERVSNELVKGLYFFDFQAIAEAFKAGVFQRNIDGKHPMVVSLHHLVIVLRVEIHQVCLCHDVPEFCAEDKRGCEVCHGVVAPFLVGDHVGFGDTERREVSDLDFPRLDVVRACRHEIGRVQAIKDCPVEYSPLLGSRKKVEGENYGEDVVHGKVISDSRWDKLSPGK